MDKRHRLSLPASSWSASLSLLIVLILSGFIVQDQVFAMCLSSGFSVFPAKGTLKQNSLIVLMAAGWYGEKIVHALNRKYPVYLESEGHKVRLKVKSIHKGSLNLSQAILEPADKLVAGKTYRLTIENLLDGADKLLRRWNPEEGRHEPIAWKVENTVDTKPPEFVYEPGLIDTRVKFYGCGPEVYVYFKMKVKDESEVLVQTELVDLENGKLTTFFLPYDNKGHLRVGHGMCSGPFEFEIHRRYRVRFRLMDLSGNESDPWTDWIEFDSPYSVSHSDGKRHDHAVKY